MGDYRFFVLFLSISVSVLISFQNCGGTQGSEGQIQTFGNGDPYEGITSAPANEKAPEVDIQNGSSSENTVLYFDIEHQCYPSKASAISIMNFGQLNGESKVIQLRSKSGHTQFFEWNQTGPTVEFTIDNEVSKNIVVSTILFNTQSSSAKLVYIDNGNKILEEVFCEKSAEL